MNKFIYLFNIYYKIGLPTALWVLLRVFVLPFYKIDKIMAKKARIVDIGCGNGGLTNYLSISGPRRSIVGIDFEEKRIRTAKRSVGKRSNIRFVNANVVKFDLPRADFYLISDVLHHINFTKQKILLKSVVDKMKNNSVLVIKEIDSTTKVQFVLGFVMEKILYPRDRIYFRNISRWRELLTELNLTMQVKSGSFYYPDSTCIIVCRKNS